MPKSYDGNLPLKPAAVLVPFVEVSGRLELLFTLRRADLKAHPGQVSFPGGRIDPSDTDSWATAVRECEEEIGIGPRRITRMGRLSDLPVITNFLITPWVAHITEPGPYTLSREEVSEVFSVPLGTFRDKRNVRTARLSRFQHEERVYFFHGGPHVVWGATAAIIAELLNVLEP